MTAVPQLNPLQALAEGATARSDWQAFTSLGRTATFWRRASKIYFAYKAAQVRARVLPYYKLSEKGKFWEKHHAWAGAEMYSLAVDMRGFYLKVNHSFTCPLLTEANVLPNPALLPLPKKGVKLLRSCRLVSSWEHAATLCLCLFVSSCQNYMIRWSFLPLRRLHDGHACHAMQSDTYCSPIH